MENNVSLSQSNHLQNCTSHWWAHQSFTLLSAAVILPSLPSCCQVREHFPKSKLSPHPLGRLLQLPSSCDQFLSPSRRSYHSMTFSKDSPLKIYTRHFPLLHPRFKMTAFLSCFPSTHTVAAKLLMCSNTLIKIGISELHTGQRAEDDTARSHSSVHH